jgi:TetR/AcrR family transcriptional regulator, ethionamide resistance regulator
VTIEQARQKAAKQADPQPRRRRRSPESAEREIVAAAESFLRERPFRDLTVDEVMGRTTLSRPSFYVYFRDRQQLAVRLVEGIGAELFEMSARWLEGTGDPRQDVHAALEGIAAVYAGHGLVLGAIADAAGHDSDVEATYRGLIVRFVDATTVRIEQDIASGRTDAIDPTETARALVWMSERYLNEALGRHPRVPVEIVVETLWTIWVRTLYAAAPVAPARS